MKTPKPPDDGRRLPDLVRRGEILPDVASRLSFDNAAPKRLRESSALSPEARDAVAAVWDGLAGAVYTDVAGKGFAAARRPSNIKRMLRSLRFELDQAQRLMIVTGVHYPAPGSSDGRHIAQVGVASGGLTVAENAMVYGSLGTAAAGAITTAMVAELVDVYLASSARTRQYQRSGRMPSADLIASDLSVALGDDKVARSTARRRAVNEALDSLAKRLMRRTASRVAKGVAIGVGVVWASAASVRDARRVLALPMSPPDDEELLRMAARSAEQH